MKYRRREKLVTIAQYKSIYDGDLAKLALDNAGIESVVMGESAGVSVFHAFVSYVKLKVFETDVEFAKEVLAKQELLCENEGNQ